MHDSGTVVQLDGGGGAFEGAALARASMDTVVRHVAGGGGDYMQAVRSAMLGNDGCELHEMCTLESGDCLCIKH